jgi:hypothetical protein
VVLSSIAYLQSQQDVYKRSPRRLEGELPTAAGGKINVTFIPGVSISGRLLYVKATYEYDGVVDPSTLPDSIVSCVVRVRWG